MNYNKFYIMKNLKDILSLLILYIILINIPNYGTGKVLTLNNLSVPNLF